MSPKEAIWKFKQNHQWELAGDKLIQQDKNGGIVEIVLNEVTSLHESHSWLIVRGGEPPKAITIPSDLNGFEQITRDLTTRCAVTPLKSKVSPVLSPSRALDSVLPIAHHFSYSCDRFDIWGGPSLDLAAVDRPFDSSHLARQTDSQAPAIFLSLELGDLSVGRFQVR